MKRDLSSITVGQLLILAREQIREANRRLLRAMFTEGLTNPEYETLKTAQREFNDAGRRLLSLNLLLGEIDEAQDQIEEEPNP